MKKGEQPELSAKWWKDSQPKGLKTAGKLDDALKDYDGAKRKLLQAGDAEAGAAANGALDAIESAAKAVSAEAGKAKNAPEMDWTVDALKKLDRLIAAERKFVDENVEDDDGMFSDPDVYHEYLLKSLKRLRSAGEMNFGVVLGKKAEDHRLAVNKAKGGKGLAGMLARETGLHAMTFGVALTPKAAGEVEAEQNEGESQDDGEGMGDERSSVLILQLEGRQLPGLKKKLTKMLKRFKPVPFKSVKLMVDGKEVEDLDDPEDTDTDNYDDGAPVVDLAALKRRLADLARQVQVVPDVARKGELARMASQANAFITAGSGSAAETALDALRDALAAGGGGTSGNGTGNGTNGGGDRAGVYAKSGEAWLKARSRVEADIEKLRAQLVETYKDDGIAGEIESRFRARVVPVLAALGANLPARLAAASGATDSNARAAQIKEAQDILTTCKAFLDSEPLIADLDANPFVPLTIHQTMSATLAALEKVVH
ncbi:MAG: hypothetical protein HIU82_09600 [Proteobacteria bacterium]|nr:hypothetical protein [Pseudomonadota bacterium]